MNYLDLEKTRQIYEEGKNITDYLKSEFKVDYNTSEIIEMAYDLQAGSYIDILNNDPVHVDLFTSEFSELLAPHLAGSNTLLDLGAGELTTLSLIMNKLPMFIDNVFAFVANMHKIPLPSNSIDVTTSSGALEPNGPELGNLLKEIFRVTRKKCVLFEPSYEHNSKEGKCRMDRLGYIRNIEGEVKKLGGYLEGVSLIKNQVNPLNPTGCFVIQPPKINNSFVSSENVFSIPGTDIPLTMDDNFYVSKRAGLAFPILKGLPIFKQESAILATSLFE
jgi:hypothetical protein